MSEAFTPGQRVRHLNGWEGVQLAVEGEWAWAQQPHCFPVTIRLADLTPIPDEVEVTVVLPREEWEAQVADTEKFPHLARPERYVDPDRSCLGSAINSSIARFRAACLAVKEDRDV